MSKQNLSCLVALKRVEELALEDSGPSPRSTEARFAGGIWHPAGSSHLDVKRVLGSDCNIRRPRWVFK